MLLSNAPVSQGCLPEGITFSGQEEIDNFQTNYPGCTEIEGDVLIWDYGTGVNNLIGLSVINKMAEIFLLWLPGHWKTLRALIIWTQ